jgi:hypothetical protein
MVRLLDDLRVVDSHFLMRLLIPLIYEKIILT